MIDRNISFSFVVKHPDADLTTVSNILGIDPFRIWRYGDQRYTKSGNKLDGKSQNSYCCLRLNNEIEGVINSIILKIKKNRDFFDRLHITGGEFSLIIFSNDSSQRYVENISWELMSSLSDLHISLIFDV